MMKSISITKHTLTNYSGFKDTKTISFVPNLPSVILGINGAGKTSLLNSIYGSIMVFISTITQPVPEEIGVSPAAIYINSTQAEVLSDFSILENQKKISFQIEFQISINGVFSMEDGGSIQNKSILKSIFENNALPLPILRYFQTEKLIEKKETISTSREYHKFENRAKGYHNHFSDYLIIQEVTNFIIDQINIENQEKIEQEDFNFSTPTGKYIRETLNAFTHILYGKTFKIGIGSSKYSNGQTLIIEQENNKIEFLQLSSGEKYLIAIVLELIYRNVTLNPELKDLRNTPGIVLIDEIESHLHPRWQLSILKALQKSFPKIQFIVSSHSPLIVSSVRREQIITLSNFDIIQNEELPDIFSGTANELLEKILFSETQINDFIEDKKEIDLLMNQFKFDLAEQKLNELKKIVKSNPEWIKDYERKITFGKA